jgi:hypothetical protein
LESWETELYNKLYKTKEEQQIFLGFQILQQGQKEKSKQSKIFLDFLNIKSKTGSKVNQS